jgi:hypothetical protein
MPKAQVPADELQTLIVQGVRRHEHCDDFRSINFLRTADIQGANWSIGSVDYGNASPEMCDSALRDIIFTMQKDYDLLD